MPRFVLFGSFTVTLLAMLGCRAQPRTPLGAAIQGEDVREVEALLARGADANEKDPGGRTALMWAARYGDTDSIRLLLQAGADPNLSDTATTGWPAIMHAIHKNQSGALRALLDGGADPNGKTKKGFTALMMAAGYGYASMVRLLLERGADPYAEMSGGGTALTAAVSGVSDIDRFTLGDCQTDTVRALLQAAPDLRLKDNFTGRMAVRVARWSGCSDVIGAVSRQ